MKTRLSSKGQLVLPAEVRDQDDLAPGDEFIVERIDRGEYRIVLVASQPNQGVVDWLLECPEATSFPSNPSPRTPCEVSRQRKRAQRGDEAGARSRSRGVASPERKADGRRSGDLGEIRFGILLLPRGRRRERLGAWFEPGVRRIHCVPWAAETGLRWAGLLSKLRRAGRAMPLKDSLIAATALVHDLWVVTRNRADFEKAGVRILDPFALP